MYPRPYGNYTLLERLGSGGMSEVDLARRTVEEANFVRFVVIKRIKTDRSTDPSFVRMFKDEARITSELHHAHIGQVYDFGKHGDEWYLALEYVPGVDVRYLINALRERQQRVPVKVALRVLCDVLDALDYAHSKRDTFGRPMAIVHRDVNPRNVMVSIRGDVKLIDFGVAKATDRLEKTRTDHIKGKFSYMAPEQISGTDIDHRADLYAVGLCLHELLSGASPYFGLNQMQILHRMMAGRMPAMPPVPELPYPDELKRVHDKALDAKPDRRYQDARTFREDLEAVARQLGGLPSHDQLARFLQQVDPALVDRLQAKMQAYAQFDVSQSGEITEPLDGGADPMPVTGASMPAASAEVDGTMGDVTSPSVTRTSVLAGGILIASITSGLGGAVLMGVVVMFGLWWLGGGQPQQQAAVSPAGLEQAEGGEAAGEEAGADVRAADVAAPTGGEAGTAGEQAEPEAGGGEGGEEGAADEAADEGGSDETETEAVVEPAPAPRPRPRPKPRPRPVPAPEPVVVPAPAPVEAPVVEPDPEPEPVEVASSAPTAAPEPAPPPEPVAHGILQIASSPSGRAILIDGEPIGKTTPHKLDWPVGTYQVQVEGFAPKTVVVEAEQVRMVPFK